jgi:hypothetical protein
LRFYCDEARRWYLVTADLLVDGTVVVASGFNAVEGTETISRSEEWYDSVVVRYAWTDSTGTRREAFDAAGTGGRVLTVDRDTPWPGVGAAVAIRGRAEGKGRVLDLTAIADPDVTPWKSLSVTLPTTPTQTGIVTSVTFDYPDDVMTVKSRGLTDTPLESWLSAPDSLLWNSLADAITWNTYA